MNIELFAVRRSTPTANTISGTGLFRITACRLAKSSVHSGCHTIVRQGHIDDADLTIKDGWTESFTEEAQRQSDELPDSGILRWTKQCDETAFCLRAQAGTDKILCRRDEIDPDGDPSRWHPENIHNQFRQVANDKVTKRFRTSLGKNEMALRQPIARC